MATSTVPMVKGTPGWGCDVRKPGKLGTKAANRGSVEPGNGACNGAEARGTRWSHGDDAQIPEIPAEPGSRTCEQNQ